MVFQVGGAHVLDWVLEVIVYVWIEMIWILVIVLWEKFGCGESLWMEKIFMVVFCGVALVIGCNIFLIWNFWFGLFVLLVIGNLVVVKLYLLVVLLFVIIV